MAAIVGESGLPAIDRRALAFADAFEREFIGQDARRSMDDTFAVGWRLLDALPRDDLVRLSDAVWTSHHEASNRSTTVTQRTHLPR